MGLPLGKEAVEESQGKPDQTSQTHPTESNRIQPNQTKSNQIKPNQTCGGGNVSRNWTRGWRKRRRNTIRSNRVELSQTRSNPVKAGIRSTRSAALRRRLRVKAGQTKSSWGSTESEQIKSGPLYGLSRPTVSEDTPPPESRWLWPPPRRRRTSKKKPCPGRGFGQYPCVKQKRKSI